MHGRRAEITDQEHLSKLLFLPWSCGTSHVLEGDMQPVLLVYFLKEICSLAIAWVQTFKMYGIEMAALFLSLANFERQVTACLQLSDPRGLLDTRCSRKP